MAVHFDAKSKSWLFVIDLPAGTDGKRRQMKRRGFRTEPEADQAERTAKQQFGKADLAANGTVAAELSAWLEERELDIAVTSLGNYRNAINRYVIPHLGARQIYALDKRAVNDLYRHLLLRGGRDDKPLAAETVRHVHRVLAKAFKDLGIVIDGIRQPRQADKETMGRKGIWNADECAAFLTHAAKDRLYAAWVLAIVCGMRRGELAGLKWPKVNLEDGIVYVHWQRAVASGVVVGGVIEKEPKGKSKRSLAIGTAITSVLGDHRAFQDNEIALLGVTYQRGGYVFCREDGAPYHPKYFTDRFRDLCHKAGVPVIALHDARHTSATVGADHGVPQHAMQKRLGHAHSRTTNDFYIHVLPESERRAAEIMEDVILRPRTTFRAA
ncbi:MAG TPA: recombinase XerD [Micromonosporaceae bacterium]|nr:recombinase XerD [Micromonosporaceae bacterium]HCU50103.1 recombinase XerD [Micromonosporaceae bacterium]